MATSRFFRKAHLVGPQGLTGLSLSTLDRMVKEGRFPRPVQLGDRAVAWPSEVVEKWMASRSAAPVAGDLQ